VRQGVGLKLVTPFGFHRGGKCNERGS
jgi:hypothetical protein